MDARLLVAIAIVGVVIFYLGSVAGLLIFAPAFGLLLENGRTGKGE